jgi:CHAT domain-containing protein
MVAAGSGQGDGELLLGRDCTWTRLQQVVAGGVGILHVACHGRFDGRHPDRSGLLLAGDDAEALPGTPSATLVSAEQLASLPLHGSLVVLSACSSGLEAVREGDEFTGVVSAMLRAGAAAVLAARWPVADSSAMLFMTDFQRRLQAAPAPADLLGLLAETAQHVRTLTSDDVIAAAFDLAQEARALGGRADEALAVATGLLRDALRTAGDQAILELVDSTAGYPAGAAAGPDAGDRLAALRKLVPRRGTRGATYPYGHPSHWGAFALIGRPEGPAAGSQSQPQEVVQQ